MALSESKGQTTVAARRQIHVLIMRETERKRNGEIEGVRFPSTTKSIRDGTGSERKKMEQDYE